MDKSILVKLVWLGAITAIPVAVLAVQKPEAHRVVETRRVVTLEQPVSIESTGEVQGPKPLESAEPPRPRTVVMSGARITSKTAPQGDPAAAAARPAPAVGGEAPASPLGKERGLTAAVAPDPALHP